MYEALGESLKGLFTLFIAAVIAVVVLAILNVKSCTRKNVIKSKTIITPEKRLVTDGRKVDTIYIYRKP